MSDDPWVTLGGAADRLVGRRVPELHLLDFYWARAQNGVPGLVLRSIDVEWIPKVLPKPRGFSLDIETGGDVVEVRIFLRAAEDRDVFLTLCRDIVDYSSSGSSSESCTKRAFRRIGHWHSLMLRARSAAMDAREIRGLIGELLILERLMVSSGTEAALNAWVAPEQHPQDFALDSRIVEVKTRTSGSRFEVQISSLEQLDVLNLPVFLLVIELLTSTQSDAMSLNDVCARLLEIAKLDGPVKEDSLDMALLKRGFVRQESYDIDKYRIAGSSAFAVREGFPKITRSQVDVRIVKAQYTIGLSTLSEFLVPVESVIG